MSLFSNAGSFAMSFGGFTPPKNVLRPPTFLDQLAAKWVAEWNARKLTAKTITKQERNDEVLRALVLDGNMREAMEFVRNTTRKTSGLTQDVALQVVNAIERKPNPGTNFRMTPGERRKVIRNAAQQADHTSVFVDDGIEDELGNFVGGGIISSTRYFGYRFRLTRRDHDKRSDVNETRRSHNRRKNCGKKRFNDRGSKRITHLSVHPMFERGIHSYLAEIEAETSID